MSQYRTIKLEGVDVWPARVEGPADVFGKTNFVLTKSRWMPDDEAIVCVLCKNKFNQIRRKHHCRMCGQVLCSKCCSEKVPLPQINCEDPERICESCRPVTEFVTKSRSHMQKFQMEAAKNVSQMCLDPRGLCKVVELGGIQMLISMATIPSGEIMSHVISGLHQLSMAHPLHNIMVEAGAIKAITKILTSQSTLPEESIIQGISALMIFCKSPTLRDKALDDGALTCVLQVLGSHVSDAVSLLAVGVLSLILENQSTHTVVVESPVNVLGKVLCLTTSQDEQMQELALKTLAHISLGSERTMHRIVQEDFSSGRPLLKALSRTPKNKQVLCNAFCLISNLATSQEDQGGMQEWMESLCECMKSDQANVELMRQMTRGLANFSAFRQNAERLIKFLPVISSKSLKSGDELVRINGLRTVLNLMVFRPNDTISELMSNGAEELLVGLTRVPDLIHTVHTSLTRQSPAKCKPQ